MSSVSRSGVSRSMEATDAATAARVARARRAAPNGWWGVALLVATEATLFGTVIASYYYLRFHNKVWPPPGVEKPAIVVPLLLTSILVATSVPLFFAARAARRGRLGTTWGLMALAMCVQIGYLVYQIILFHSDVDKFQPSGSAYGSIYFTMLGLHHAHVLVGILLEAGMLARLASGLTNYRVIGVRVIALYWYLVSAAGVFVVLTQLSPSL
jgi:heme/copper-type cytochrome/quinol oxidase subunit 3